MGKAFPQKFIAEVPDHLFNDDRLKINFTDATIPELKNFTHFDVVYPQAKSEARAIAAFFAVSAKIVRRPQIIDLA